jgi:hypothetical protein
MVVGGVAYNESRLLSWSIPVHRSTAMTDSSRPVSSAQELALWAALTAVLIGGLVLYFRFADRIVPLLEVVTDK